MEIKEAIQRIDEHKRIHFKREPFAVYITEALEMAKSALERQLPKKPNIAKKNFICPNCKVLLLSDMQFCKFCGQALDWHIERNEVK